MNLNIVCCLFVLDKECSCNIRKNDNLKLKLLVDNNNELPAINFDNITNIKNLIRNKISSIIDSNMFHLEQVYTLGDDKFFSDNKIDIIYLAITNICNIKNLNNNYKLIPFEISNNKVINFNNEKFNYKTIKVKDNNNIEFFFDIDVCDLNIEKKLIEILTAYKQLRLKIDNSDIIFKFMEKKFTLEDVRLVYEMIKDTSVDKSNFRKKIMKYCEKTNDIIDKKGYRPTQLYSFKPIDEDVWL